MESNSTITSKNFALWTANKSHLTYTVHRYVQEVSGLPAKDFDYKVIIGGHSYVFGSVSIRDRSIRPGTIQPMDNSPTETMLLLRKNMRTYGVTAKGIYMRELSQRDLPSQGKFSLGKLYQGKLSVDETFISFPL